jgi:putative sigma-54 modulation protein
MNLNITGHHVEVTPAIRDYVKGKLERVLRHFDQVTSSHVILSVEKLQQKAEVTLHVKGKDIFADAIDADLYAAIDLVADKLDRQVVKHKEKVSNHNNHDKRQQASDDNPRPAVATRPAGLALYSRPLHLRSHAGLPPS